METNKILQNQIMEIVDNQLSANNPVETKQTYERLMGEGYDEVDAKKLIGQCILVEIMDIMENHTAFDEKRYVKNLKNLPKKPF